MRLFIRITVIGCFAAAGVAVAIAVAQHRPATSEPKPGAITSEAEPITDDSASLAPSLATGQPTVASIPIAAPVAGPTASQAPVSEALNQVQDSIDESQQTILDALSEFQRQRQSPQPATPPADVAEAIPPAAQPQPQVNLPIIESEGDNRLSISIQDSDIRTVLELLSRQGDLNILPSASVSGNVSATLTGVDLITALDAILKSAGYVAKQEGRFIYVGTPADFEQMNFARERIVTRVFRPNYVTAADLQTLIAPLLTPQVGEATIGAGGATRVAVSPEALQGIESNTTQTGGDDFAGGDVLLVRDYESVMRQVEDVVVEVDQKPKQVSIEAIIIGVRLDDSNTLGVNFELLRDQDNSRLILGQPIQNLGQISVDEGGLKFGFLDSSLSVFIEALETVGDTDVIASPRLMCLNKQRAEILIGSQLGYVSTTVTENAATQAVEFLEVGTQLRLRPYISSDNTIRMEVHPELSTGTVRVEQGLTLPDKETTQVTTNVMCRDGKTIVIGGLIREDITSTATQIPWLGAAPIIGPVFRQKVETLERRELIVLLTPRIVREPEGYIEGSNAHRDFARRQALYFDKTSYLGRRHIGQKYFRLAHSAWNAGDVRAAFRYINLALHYDPQNLAISTLRGEIVDAYPDLDIPLHQRLNQGLTPWTHPVRNYPKQGVPWNTPYFGEPYSEIQVEDVGVPGESREIR